MTPATRLSTALDDRLDGLPSVPPEHYLASARGAARRRRRRRAAVAAGVVAVGVFAAGAALPGDDGPQRAREHEPSVATGTTRTAASLSSLPVEPGLGSIDAFTTDDIPEWATEYGNHGPASIAPDGRLWIAPEATVVRSVEEPFAATGDGADVAHSYAVEVRWQGGDDKLATDGSPSSPPPGWSSSGVVWSFVYQPRGETYTLGELDSPDRWTSDFALWVDDHVAGTVDRPSFAERLARFADDRSEEVVAGPGVEIVRQVPDVGTGDREQYARQTAAQVRVGGQTWFVLATGRPVGHAFYEAYDETASGATDLDGFLRFVDAGMVRPDGAS